MPAALGVLLALGPVLGWRGHALTFDGVAVQLPAVVLRWLGVPLAHGGQYYRCVLLAHLGLAGMLAAGSRARWLPLLALLGVGDALRSVAVFGLPWPVVDLPTDSWEEWASDAAPGAVLHLPMFSPHVVPCNPVRLAGHSIHGRPLADMPRFHQKAPDVPILVQMDDCTRRGRACDPPSRADLARAGFRYAVIDLPDVPERLVLDRRLCSLWGEPDGRRGDLAWWRLESVPGRE